MECLVCASKLTSMDHKYCSDTCRKKVQEDAIRALGKFLVLLLIIVGCSHSEERGKSTAPEGYDPLPVVKVYGERLVGEFNEDGWVVSRHEDGSTEHEGDSLLWTGLALGVLPCSYVGVFSDRMIKMIKDHDGALVRYEPLGEYAGGREVTFDGATGLYYGVASLIQRCPDVVSLWKDPWELHLNYLEKADGRLNVKAEHDARLFEPWGVLPDLIGHLLGLRDDHPSRARMNALELESALWTAATYSAKKPCYRMHLSYLHIRTLDRFGHLSDEGRKSFCSASEGAKIALYDGFCNRGDILGWMAGYEPDVYEYAHQRCPEWEHPDAGSLRTPDLDYLMAYDQYMSTF